MLPVFIGYDERQPVNFTALAQSIISRCSEPVAITPIVLKTLAQYGFTREGLTPFTFSRFLVPSLMSFKGWALFLDVDQIVLGDLGDLFALRDDRYAVMVSKNEKRFEWASVMLFNCAHPDNAVMTPQFLMTAHNLHSISWTDKIGDLPREWNHLVGYDKPRTDAKIVHYTQGTPAFPETRTEYVKEWIDAIDMAASCLSWKELMGPSVHAKPVIDRLLREGKIKMATP